ncbi:hypothetical protein [Vibrio phage vB_ValS_PJ32]|nr:hypothetical protein [Vibrio phage vB_ValS_PJ32]
MLDVLIGAIILYFVLSFLVKKLAKGRTVAEDKREDLKQRKARVITEYWSVYREASQTSYTDARCDYWREQLDTHLLENNLAAAWETVRTFNGAVAFYRGEPDEAAGLNPDQWCDIAEEATQAALRTTTVKYHRATIADLGGAAKFSFKTKDHGQGCRRVDELNDIVRVKLGAL